jgi:hypothetical protein
MGWQGRRSGSVAPQANGRYQVFTTFFAPKAPELLGHVVLYDPVSGWLNLIQSLRVGIYHDELHFEEIRSHLRRLA